MTPHAAARALVGGIGVVASLVVGAVVAALVLVALGLPAESRADDTPPAPASIVEPRPTELVVALGLGDPVLQAGAVRDGQVILARGLEVDIARDLARRLRIPRVRFVYVRPASRLLAATVRPWHVTIASIRPVRAAAAVADLSKPYLGTDQAVVLRRGLPRLTALGDLRDRVTCALRGSDGARAITASVRPAVRPILAPSNERLLQLVQTGACDAAVVPAGSVGRFVADRGGLLGPVAARIEFGGGYVVAVTRGGPIAVAEVDRALERMRADGTMHRLARAWLGIDPTRLRTLD
jgi:ABC-type amino acid transport substrate-binding protein